MRFVEFILISVIFFAFGMESDAQVGNKIGGFNNIEVFGRMNIRLEQSNGDSIFINSREGGDISSVKYSVEDSVLKIKMLSDLPKANKVYITIQFNELATIKVGGGVILYNKGAIEGDILTVSAKSGSEIELLVHIDSLTVKASQKAFVRMAGSNRIMSVSTSLGADFRSTDMQNSITIASIKGGSAEINVADYLDVMIKHGASLKYVKKPLKIKKRKKLKGTMELLEDF